MKAVLIEQLSVVNFMYSEYLPRTSRHMGVIATMTSVHAFDKRVSQQRHRALDFHVYDSEQHVIHRTECA